MPSCPPVNSQSSTTLGARSAVKEMSIPCPYSFPSIEIEQSRIVT